MNNLSNGMMNDTATPFFFEDYVEDTLDPGWSLVIGSLVACVLLHATLPCMLSLGSRYERRQTSKRRRGNGKLKDEDSDSDEEKYKKETGDDFSIKKATGPSVMLEKMHSKIPTVERSKSSDSAANSRSNSKSSTKRKKKLKANGTFTCPTVKENEGLIVAEENNVSSSGSKNLTLDTINHQLDPPGTKVSLAPSSSTNTMVTSPTCFGDGLIRVFCGATESLNQSPLPHTGSQRSLRRSGGSSSVGAVKHTSRKGKKKSIKQTTSNDENDDAAIYKEQTCDQSLESSVQRTVMSRLQHDDVSFSEAIDRYTISPVGAKNSLLTLKENEDGNNFRVDILYGERAWWKPKMIKSWFDNLVEISDWDDEMNTLLRIAFPVSLQGVIVGVLQLTDVSLIGYMVGTEEAGVFVLVSVLTWLPTTIAYGFLEASAKLVPNALERSDSKLAATYFCTSISLFTLAMIPISVFWCFMTKATFERFGFPNSTALLAQEYAYFQVGQEMISGVVYAVHLFLDIGGHERFSSYSNLLFGLGQTLVIVPTSLMGTNRVFYIGLGRVSVGALHLLLCVFLAACWGWFAKCLSGTPGFLLMKKEVTKAVVITAGPMGVLYLLNYGEWELLTLFVAALGPAEMVAWAMLGNLWSILKFFSDGFADAAETQCALHLFSNNPNLARSSAIKSQFLGYYLSICVTSLLFIVGTEFTKAMSPDPTLKRLLVELFPLVGIGNVVLASGSISASLLSAQERSGMATLVQFLGNWCLTLAVGCVFSFAFRIDLQGLTTAVVLGLGLASAGNSFLLHRSEWDVMASTLSRRLLDDQLQKGQIS